MKKLFIILLSALSLTAFAQNDVKRVAILEIVDKMETVPYMKKLVFRSNLTTAISNTLGYEGYDRVDVSQILGEQNFQRTGLVSDQDIKKIGEFTGAKYVVIAEAAIDGEEMFITAKITDVESARVLRNSNQLMGTTTAEMKTGSEKVAVDLLTPTPEERAQMAQKEKEEKIRAEKRRREEAVEQQLALGYIKFGSLYVTKTLQDKQLDWNVIQTWPQRCEIGGWHDWRLPTDSEADWIQWCTDINNPSYKIEAWYLNRNEYKQWNDWWCQGIILNNGNVNKGCDVCIRYCVILVRGHK